MMTCSFRENFLNEHLIKRICFLEQEGWFCEYVVKPKSNELAGIIFNLRFSN